MPVAIPLAILVVLSARIQAEEELFADEAGQ